ncbi:hypothetical protein JD844_018879, partial [Phrynosoma platyrhinos]
AKSSGKATAFSDFSELTKLGPGWGGYILNCESSLCLQIFSFISFQDIRHEASDFPCKVAKLPRNKNRNRYRDVSPFDHSRIKLQQGDNDYINASLIKMEEANRSYILTQVSALESGRKTESIYSISFLFSSL